MKAVAEAPSKAIITGEHFVVHGAWALAAALPRRVRVEVSPAPKLVVISDRIGGNESALAPVAFAVRAMAKELSFKPEVRVSIISQIPEGAGLGSSAATMVALVSALSRLNSLGLSSSEIIRHAMVGETEVHGRPSGIDPTISAMGGVILFRPGSRTSRVVFEGARSLIISFSGKSRSTRHLINRVALTKEERPEFFESLTESVSDVSRQAAERLASGEMKSLGKLLTFNQGILSALGVSNRRLDRMVDLLVSLGSYGAKLTGAGGGGSVVAVAPEAKEKRIVSGLLARGFETFQAVLPAEGVKSWLER